MSAARTPLLAPRDAAAPLAWRHGQAVSGAQFLAAAQALAARLPDGRPVNLCQDRLRFALGLTAALLRGQPSLLPPNALPETLRQVPAGDGEPYLLIDGDTAAPPGLRVHRLHGPVLAADGSAAGAATLPVVVPSAAANPPMAPAWPAAGDAAPGAVPAVDGNAAPGAAVPTVDGDAPAVCLLTSGSTGAPQPHAKRWGALAVNIASEAARLAEHLGRPSLAGVTVVATVPAQHSYGLESSVLLALLGGAAFDAGLPFYPADIAAALAAVPRPRALVTTPFHLKTLLRAGVALPPVDLVLSATAPLSPQLAQEAETAFGGVLVEIYGCTEAGQVASRRTTDGDTWTTLGALRLRAVQPGDAGAPAEAAGRDDPLRSTVLGGHVEAPTVLADLIERHDARRFRLLGRANDLIHVGGKRTSLGHLNFHLNRIDGVDDGACWLPDGEAVDGETVVRPLALVVAPRLTAAQITAALRGVLEPVFVPRRVLHVDALPREATGKLTAAALRDAVQRALAAEADGSALRVQRLVFDATHPALAGHFPGHPVLPGTVLLAAVLDAVAAEPALRRRLGAAPRVEQAKFLAPVMPAPGGTALRLTLRPDARGGVAVELHAEAGTADAAEPLVLRAQLAPGAGGGAA